MDFGGLKGEMSEDGPADFPMGMLDVVADKLGMLG